MISIVLATIVPTFGTVFVGWLCRVTKIWGKESVQVLNNYAYYIALPALIFQAIFELDIISSATPADLKFLVGITAAHLAAGAIAMIAVARAKTPLRAVAPILVTFGSTAYLGIPFATFAFGNEGTAFAAIGSVVLVVVLLFFSLAILNHNASPGRREAIWHQLLELPFLWVVLGALLLPTIGIRALPDFLVSTIDIFAGSAGPTALLALGAFNFDLSFTDIPWKQALVLGVGKIITPVAGTLLFLSWLGVTGLHLAVGVALAATSTAVTAFVLADEYQTGRTLVAGTLAVSTFASLIALTLVVYLWNATNIFG
jgi:malonate transporter and related proteins